MIAAKPFLAEGKQEGKNMERTNKLWILDSTLRDGAQGENISFSVQDKLRIVSALDQLGIDYIEAGNPASNPKDLEFFERRCRSAMQSWRPSAAPDARTSAPRTARACAPCCRQTPPPSASLARAGTFTSPTSCTRRWRRTCG